MVHFGDVLLGQLLSTQYNDAGAKPAVLAPHEATSIDDTGRPKTTTDLAVEDRHDNEDADSQRIDDELAVEVGAVDAAAERALDN